MWSLMAAKMNKICVYIRNNVKCKCTKNIKKQ